MVLRKTLLAAYCCLSCLAALPCCGNRPAPGALEGGAPDRKRQFDLDCTFQARCKAGFDDRGVGRAACDWGPCCPEELNVLVYACDGTTRRCFGFDSCVPAGWEGKTGLLWLLCLQPPPFMPEAVRPNCVQCWDPSDCAPAVFKGGCNERTGFCAECRTDADCATPPRNHGCSKDGMCQQCASSGDCVVWGQSYCDLNGFCD